MTADERARERSNELFERVMQEVDKISRMSLPPTKEEVGELIDREEAIENER